MINRVLIRIKVVQLLYSYLLVENQFNIESQPVSPTKEKRFAYGLYLDMLYLMTRIAGGITVRGTGASLQETRFYKRIMADDHIRNLYYKYGENGGPFHSQLQILTDTLKESAIYKKFRKAEHPDSIANESVWVEIFNLIIMSSPEVNRIISDMENFTLRGVDRMREMMSGTFSNFFAAGDHLPDALKTLSRSMQMARELYFRLLALPVALTAIREQEIEDARNKYLLTDEDRNPNLRFVENRLTTLLRENEQIEQYITSKGIAWLPEDEQMIRLLLKAIMASETYKQYMEEPATDLTMDCEFWRAIFKNVIFSNPDFLETLEEKSVFWNDDLDIMGTFVLKTFNRICDSAKKEDAEKIDNPIYDMYKDEEDARFGAELFSYVIRNKEDYRAILNEVIDKTQWELERLAYMDVVILLTAMGEMLNFPKIPLKVTINEYIEIAKSYSTAKSATFVNGLLYNIITKLQEEHKLLKK